MFDDWAKPRQINCICIVHKEHGMRIADIDRDRVFQLFPAQGH